MSNPNLGMVRHVVLFKFKDSTREAQIRNIEQEFAKLPGKIEAITDFEWGTDISAESRAQGFTHCFIVTFKDEAGRDAYLPHPAHEAFKEILLPCVADVLVLDYIAKG